MASRPKLTLLFLGATGTGRLDVGAGPEFAVQAESWSADAGDPAQPAGRVTAALTGGGPVGRAVWVLWEGAWTQTAELPVATVSGLPDDQLALTLGFEAEPLSGLPAADSVTVAVPVTPAAPGAGAAGLTKTFWLSQVARSVRDDFDEAVRKAGARLAGVLHPGGLARASWGDSPAPAAGPKEWKRVEVWEGATVLLSGRADGTVAVSVSHSRAGSSAWRNELAAFGAAAWTGRTPPPEILGDSGEPIEWTQAALPDGAVPSAWLRAWAAELEAAASSKSRRFPLIVPPPRPFAHTHWVIGGVAAAAAIALCSLHWISVTAQTAEARDEADRLTEMQSAAKTRLNAAAGLPPPAQREAEEKAAKAETAEHEERIKELDAEETALLKEREVVEAAARDLTERERRRQDLASRHRRAVPELLAALVDAEKNESPAEVIVKEVRLEPSGELRLTGLSARPGLADRFARKLSERLTGHGWKVGPAGKRLREDREAFDFALLLTPKVLYDQATGIAGGPAASAHPGQAAPSPTAPVVPGQGRPVVPSAVPVIPGVPGVPGGSGPAVATAPGAPGIPVVTPASAPGVANPSNPPRRPNKPTKPPATPYPILPDRRPQR
jgi:hypothetical protein